MSNQIKVKVVLPAILVHTEQVQGTVPLDSPSTVACLHCDGATLLSVHRLHCALLLVGMMLAERCSADSAPCMRMEQVHQVSLIVSTRHNFT